MVPSLTVNPKLENDTDTSFRSLETAIEHAQQGATLHLDGEFFITEELVIKKSIRLDGQKNSILHVSSLVIDIPVTQKTACEISNLTIYNTTTPGIRVNNGTLLINYCQFIYLTLSTAILVLPNANAVIADNIFEGHKADNGSVGEFSVSPLLDIEGEAEILRNKIIGNSFWDIAIAVHKKAVIHNNSITSVESGIIVFKSAQAFIQDNIIKSCSIGLSCSGKAKVIATSNTIERHVIGVQADGNVNLTMTSNIIRYTIGPAIAIPALAESPNLSNNKFSYGKTVAVRCSNSRKGLADKIEHSNKFKEYEMGVVISSNKLDLVLATIDELALSRDASLADLGQRFQKSFYDVQVSKISKALKHYPELFVLEDDGVCFSRTALAFIEHEEETTSEDNFDMQFTVERTISSSTRTIWKDILEAQDGDLIEVKASKKYETLDWYDIDPKTICIQGKARSCVLKVEHLYTSAGGTVFFKNLTLQFGEFGISGNVIIEDCTIGGILSVHVRGVLVVKNCEITMKKPEIGVPITAAFVEGKAQFINNKITGDLGSQCGIMIRAGKAVIKSNHFQKVTVAISIESTSTVEIDSNTIESCTRAIEMEGNNVHAIIHNNRIWNSYIALDFVLTGTQCELTITNNIIKHVIGPAISLFSEVPAIIKKNEIAEGLSVGMRLPQHKRYERVRRDNKMQGFPLGNIKSSDPKTDVLIGTIAQMMKVYPVTATHLGSVLKKPPFNLQISKISKILQQYDIFAADDQSFSWNINTLRYFESGFETADFSPIEDLDEPSNNNNNHNDNNKSMQKSINTHKQDTEKEQIAAQEPKSIEEHKVPEPEPPKEDPPSVEPPPQQAKPEPAPQPPQHGQEAPLEEEEGFEVVSRKKAPQGNRKQNSSSNARPSSSPGPISWAEKAKTPMKQASKPPASPSNANDNNRLQPQKPKRQDWSKHARKIFDRTGGLCYLCRKPMKYENRHKGQEGAWHIEHVMPFSKYPELDNLANLLPAHIDCDSCKGANHLLSIVNEADFDLLTINIASLHPQVAQEMRAAKELAKGKFVKQPRLLKAEQFPVVSDSPAPKTPEAAKHEDKANDNKPPNTPSKKQFEVSDKFVIPFSELKISEERLGEGSFSTVWKAKYNGTPVAVKKIHDFSVEYTKEFQREVGILSNLRHPNIILMMGVCLPPDPCVIVTELFEKRSLQHVLDSKDPLTEKQKVNFALDIARGMCYLHKIKILHLDLKPLNVMVDNSGTCKIADFGLSKVLSLSSTGNHYVTNQGLIGTMLYMSPEMLAESPTVDFKADVYSFGIILWQIHTRMPPYQKMTALSIMREVAEKKTRPKIPPDCRESYGMLMIHCWEHEPEDRPMFDAVVEKLEELLQQITTE